MYYLLNTHTGTLVHESLFKLKAFETREDAIKFMKIRNLNKSVYRICIRNKNGHFYIYDYIYDY